MFAFKYRDPLTGRWVKARSRAELHKIRERYREWETPARRNFVSDRQRRLV